MKQLKLFHEKAELEFGGTLDPGVRKRARPIFTKSPSHYVLKAEDSEILLKNKDLVEETIRRFSLKFGIVLYDLAIQPDHAHIVNHIPSRSAYNKWTRSITGVLSRTLKIKWRLYIGSSPAGGELAERAAIGSLKRPSMESYPQKVRP